MRKRHSLEAVEESVTPLKKTREASGFLFSLCSRTCSHVALQMQMLGVSPGSLGPTDECRAMPLRAAGTPLSVRRRARPDPADDDAADSPRVSKRGPAAVATGGEGARRAVDPRVFVPAAPFAVAAPPGMYTGAQVAAMITGAVRDRERQVRDFLGVGVFLG